MQLTPIDPATSFEKGGFGDISELVFISPPVSFFLPFPTTPPTMNF